MDTTRPAGLNELRCIARDDLKLYGSIVTVGLYAGPRTPTHDDLVKVIKRCITTHPVLAVCIQGADTERPQLVQTDHLDLDAHLQMLEQSSSDDGSLQLLLKTIHNDPLPSPRIRSQWRVIFQPADGNRFRLALACSHSLVDGKSGYVFHSTFLKCLQSLHLITEDSSPMWRVTRQSAILQSLEAAGHLAISWSFLLGPLIQEYLPMSIRRWVGVDSTSSEGVWLGAPSRPSRTPSDPATCVVVTSVPADIVERVAAVCRKNNARLTGLLNNIVARCLGRALARRRQSWFKFVCETPIDMRRCLKKGDGQMVNYVSAVTEVISIEDFEDSIDWGAVQRSTQILEERSESSRDQPIGLLKYLNDFRGWTLKKASSRPETSFSVSNLGVFNETASGWRVETIAFSQSGNGTGEPLSVSVASVKDGPLTLAMTWWPGMLGVAEEEAFVQEVGHDVVAELGSIA